MIARFPRPQVLSFEHRIPSLLSSHKGLMECCIERRTFGGDKET